MRTAAGERGVYEDSRGGASTFCGLFGFSFQTLRAARKAPENLRKHKRLTETLPITRS
jgi:hypothetical protein